MNVILQNPQMRVLINVENLLKIAPNPYKVLGYVSKLTNVVTIYIYSLLLHIIAIFNLFLKKPNNCLKNCQNFVSSFMKSYGCLRFFKIILISGFYSIYFFKYLDLKIIWKFKYLPNIKFNVLQQWSIHCQKEIFLIWSNKDTKIRYPCVQIEIWNELDLKDIWKGVKTSF